MTQTAPAPGDLLTVAEVAEILKGTERGTRALIKRGELDAIKVNGVFRITRQSLAALVKRSRVQPSAASVAITEYDRRTA